MGRAGPGRAGDSCGQNIPVRGPACGRRRPGFSGRGTSSMSVSVAFRERKIPQVASAGLIRGWGGRRVERTSRAGGPPQFRRVGSGAGRVTVQPSRGRAVQAGTYGRRRCAARPEMRADRETRAAAAASRPGATDGLPAPRGGGQWYRWRWGRWRSAGRP